MRCVTHFSRSVIRSNAFFPISEPSSMCYLSEANEVVLRQPSAGRSTRGQREIGGTAAWQQPSRWQQPSLSRSPIRGASAHAMASLRLRDPRLRLRDILILVATHHYSQGDSRPPGPRPQLGRGHCNLPTLVLRARVGSSRLLQRLLPPPNHRRTASQLSPTQRSLAHSS